MWDEPINVGKVPINVGKGTQHFHTVGKKIRWTGIEPSHVVGPLHILNFVNLLSVCPEVFKNEFAQAQRIEKHPGGATIDQGGRSNSESQGGGCGL
mgnify:CR=1 FL=1